MNQPQQAPPSPERDPAPPQPTFDAIPLSSDVRKAIDALGYVNPTPVQLAVFEPAVRGKSLVVQARTGTGKTAAFGLPIIDQLVKKSQANVQALILTPTRELALQVARELEQIAQFRGTKIVAIYGGAPMGRQVEQLQGGAQIVCGTPGRVLDHLRRGTFDASHVRIFVLDEADEMLSMGFAKELHAIIAELPKERQGLYFSATIPPDVERLANSHLKDPEYVTLSSDQVGALEVNHYVYLVREGDKRSALLRIIEVENPESAIVFCNTKDETERVAEALQNRGYDAAWLNGDLEQRDREKVMAATREGKLRFLVATDVAARGIDISHLTHVINADFPESAEQYVHRTGRTGRAGRTGTAIAVVGPKDVGHLYMLRLTYKIRPIERALPTKGELRTRAEADLIGFLSEAYAGQTTDPMHLAVAKRLLTHDQVEVIVAGLLADHLGARQSPDVVQDAAEARRAKNPPAEVKPEPTRRVPPPRHEAPRHEAPRHEAPRHESPRQAVSVDMPPREPRSRSEVPRTLRDGEQHIDKGRPVRSKRRSAEREGIPQATLSQWEPPADVDDDRPILKESAPKPVEDHGHSKVDVHALTEAHPNVGATPNEASTKPAARERTGRIRSERGRERERERDQDDEPIGEGFSNLFLNIGKRDGLGPSDLQKILGDAGIASPDVGRIRVRDRITFVAVKKEEADRAIRALAGQVFGTRTISAEPARETK